MTELKEISKMLHGLITGLTLKIILEVSQG